MRKIAAAFTLASVLTLGSGSAAFAQEQAQAAQAEVDEDDNGEIGLIGLVGLAGLAGLAGLKRRDRYPDRDRNMTRRDPGVR